MLLELEVQDLEQLIGLNGLEGYLEEISKTSHEEFRCFISSEPPPWLI